MVVCGVAAAPASPQSSHGDCTPAPEYQQVQDTQAASPNAPNPLVGLPWFVDQGKYFVPWQKYLAAEGEKKSLIGKIALNPQFRWFGRWDLKYGSMGIAVRQYLERVYCAGAVAQIATFLTEAEKCGPRYQGGGPPQHQLAGGGHRLPPRGHRLRAGLARNRGLPGAQPPRGAHEQSPLRRGRALAGPERHGLHRGRGA